ncbi:hypothetical protein [Pseudoalteromonas phage H105/1]|uniref:hypothetical protein n=1 Tax=Pseudoalteromonas phage H105/1 TaxID=877240 RepID=UPI0001E439DA|nr:hypothetical protein AV949_gp23 [Pseudoalteromonas phage H105/1]ADM26683.1 hypothetical protein [Pseudoalteromonas phage H105/1]
MRFKFNVDVYDFKVTFTDEKDYADRATNNGSGVDYGRFYCSENKSLGKIFILCARDDEKLTPYYLQCLSHECNHAAMCILGISDVNFSYKDQEALCYLQDYIFGRILNKIWVS